MTAIVVGVIYFTQKEVDATYMKDFWQPVLPGILLIGLVFSILGVGMVGLTKLLNRISARDEY